MHAIGAARIEFSIEEQACGYRHDGRVAIAIPPPCIIRRIAPLAIRHQRGDA
ncbi:hypothetical protein P0F65_10240 [Sphingomonas sp. I4]